MFNHTDGIILYKYTPFKQREVKNHRLRIRVNIFARVYRYVHSNMCTHMLYTTNNGVRIDSIMVK